MPGTVAPEALPGKRAYFLPLFGGGGARLRVFVQIFVLIVPSLRPFRLSGEVWPRRDLLKKARLPSLAKALARLSA